MKVRRLAIIGCGLMGGSFALALKKAGLVGEVAGASRSMRSVEQARSLGVIDQVCDSAAQAASGADVVLVAVPVASTEQAFRELAPQLQADALLMDVGSTKRDVVAAATRALGARQAQFVPAHPIAGKESAGIAHASADLYQARLAVLTPVPENDQAMVDRARDLWRSVGSSVSLMSPQEHDATFAAVSHLPHLLAFAYFRGINGQRDASRHLAMAGPGFRDFTRIAASDPAVWKDILSANSDEVLEQLRWFRAELDRFEAALVQGHAEGLRELIAPASRARAAWQLGAAVKDE